MGLWVNPNVKDIISKLSTWKLHGISLGLTKQGKTVKRLLGLKSQVSRLFKTHE